MKHTPSANFPSFPQHYASSPVVIPIPPSFFLRTTVLSCHYCPPPFLKLLFHPLLHFPMPPSPQTL